MTEFGPLSKTKKRAGYIARMTPEKKWTQVNSERKLRQRAWYYTRVYADTEDEDVVYVMNVRYHKSTDGGKTFNTFNAPHGITMIYGFHQKTPSG